MERNTEIGFRATSDSPTNSGKTLRIGVLGFKPYITMDRRDASGRPDGTDMRLVNGRLIGFDD